MHRACIDIGSNTTRLLIAECDGQALHEVHQERAFTQIGRDLAADGMIGEEKIAEICRVVAEQVASARAYGAVEVRCVATAAVRRARNTGELVASIAERCEGLSVEVLSGEQEARFAFLGAAGTLASVPAGPIAVVDIGGGSSEIVVGEAPGDVHWWASVALGSSDLARRMSGDPPAAADLAAARAQVDALLNELEPPQVDLAVAVGGSATSLRRLGGAVLDDDAFERLLAMLRANGALELAGRYALDVERVRLLPAGLTILHAISRRLQAPLAVGLGGLREGVLLDSSG